MQYSDAISPVGGYFGLELNDNKTVYHDGAIPVNSGRNALEYILLANNGYKKIYAPYYCCDVILQPIKRLNLEYEFYSINQDLTPRIKRLSKKGIILYINYFGIANKIIKGIAKEYENLIVDNSQAFFANPIRNIPTFYSLRKFLGLPDGGFAYVNKSIECVLDRDKSSDRFSHLLQCAENGPEAGYKYFKANEKMFDNLPLRKMSVITEKIMRNINFKTMQKKRNDNFTYIHKYLKHINEFTNIIENESLNAPMIYPFLRRGNKPLKDLLINKNIFVATYWESVYKYAKVNSWEYYLADNLIPLPINQNITHKEIDYMVENIFNKIKND